jgi:hypothetical protein
MLCASQPRMGKGDGGGVSLMDAAGRYAKAARISLAVAEPTLRRMWRKDIPASGIGAFTLDHY